MLRAIIGQERGWDTLDPASGERSVGMAGAINNHQIALMVGVPMLLSLVAGLLVAWRL